MSSRIEKLAKEWSDEREPVTTAVKEKISRFLHPPPAMRHRIAMALYKIRMQVNRLDYILNKLQERDKMLFDKAVSAQMVRDNARATIYANEIAELRKIARTMLRAQLALEQVSLRLETIQELGDVLVAMAPVIGVVRDIKKQLMGVVPEIALELTEIDEELRRIVIEAGEFTGMGAEVTVTSPEAKKILEEAATIAEMKMRERFPELPEGVGTQEMPAPPKQSG